MIVVSSSCGPGWCISRRCAKRRPAEKVVLANGQGLFFERNLALGLGLDEFVLNTDLCLNGCDEFLNSFASLKRIGRRDALGASRLFKSCRTAGISSAMAGTIGMDGE